jgi:malate dehydrogenase (oxaloacetate-decarboxylating)
MAATKLLLASRVADVVVVGRSGILCERTGAGLLPHERWLARRTNCRGVGGGLAEALTDADVLIACSRLDEGDLAGLERMAPVPVILALGGLAPEINSDELEERTGVFAARQPGHRNDMDPALVFPGLFRGLLETPSASLTSAAQRGVARALADHVSHAEPDRILPRVFDGDVVDVVAGAVRSAGRAQHAPSNNGRRRSGRAL